MEFQKSNIKEVSQKTSINPEHMTKYLALMIFCSEVIQNIHWVSKGSIYYSDHLLYERIYESVSGNIDEMAEKAVGLSGDSSVNPHAICSLKSELYKNLIPNYNSDLSPDELAEYALFVMACFMEKTEEFYQKLSEAKMITLGLEDFIPKIHSETENNMYLLKRRVKSS
ncbi:hypothetical protein N9W84_01215 [bacterium]|nr:hypothetical protein [bacterium]